MIRNGEDLKAMANRLRQKMRPAELSAFRQFVLLADSDQLEIVDDGCGIPLPPTDWPSEMQYIQWFQHDLVITLAIRLKTRPTNNDVLEVIQGLAMLYWDLANEFYEFDYEEEERRCALPR